MSDPVVIVGAGLSGLTAARLLHERGIEVCLFESADDVGGRVRTDLVDGFRLDRGFQVFLDSYPEAQQMLDYDSLRLRRFEPGSLIVTNAGVRRLVDPWRRPLGGIRSVFQGVGSFADKLRIAALRGKVGQGTPSLLFESHDETSESALRKMGFSDSMMEQFLRPFFGGVFLDMDLQTSCRMLYFVFRMFSNGNATLPELGMGEIGKQLAASLPEDSIRLGDGLEQLEHHAVRLQSGKVVPYSHVVLALDEVTASRFLPELGTQRKPRSVHTLYFAAEQTPSKEKMLTLNGLGRGLINHVCVPSDVAKSYAPPEQSLISVTVLKAGGEDPALYQRVQCEAEEWFGKQVKGWRHLRTDHITRALPNQSFPAFNPPRHPPHLRDNLYVCGDYRTNGSINGAMESGRLAAEAICAAD
ncbi:FAD-dependent oxidoreductase [bacterium]|nr:FAD-dependent oxidoreductase [bacterium]